MVRITLGQMKRNDQPGISRLRLSIALRAGCASPARLKQQHGNAFSARDRPRSPQTGGLASWWDVRLVPAVCESCWRGGTVTCLKGDLSPAGMPDCAAPFAAFLTVAARLNAFNVATIHVHPFLPAAVNRRYGGVALSCCQTGNGT